MKKRIFFAMLISAFAAGAFLVSCDDDDDDDALTCTCTEYDNITDEEVGSGKVSIEGTGANNCDELSDLMDDEDFYYICY